MVSGMNQALLEISGLTKSYPGVMALSGVDLTVHAGEVRALVGENGSGKSTLAKVLYGATDPDAGSVLFAGQVLEFGKPAWSLGQGIVAISQELTLSPELTVTENVLMGRLPTRLGFVNWRRAHQMTGKYLDDLGLAIDPRIKVGDLSIELQQCVEICRALSRDAALIILDEATSSLGQHASELLLDRVREKARAGAAVLLITHRMAEIREVADSATILRDGLLIDTLALDSVTDDDILRMMVGRELRDIYGHRDRTLGPPLLSLRGVSALDGSFTSLSLQVRAGEIVGIAGLVGCGKSELALAIAGAQPVTGSVEVGGVPLETGSVAKAIKQGVALIPEDRKRQGLLPTLDVLENMSLPWSSLGTRLGIIQRKKQEQVAQDLIDRLRLKTSSMSANIYTLSGGNQQKAMVARWIPLAPRVFVLVEPTRGVDVGAKTAIYGIIQELARGGMAILLVSSELPEILGLSDRILVMFEGSITAEIDAVSASEHEVAAWVLGRSAA